MLPKIIGKDESTGKQHWLFGMKNTSNLCRVLAGCEEDKSRKARVFSMSMSEAIYDSVGCPNTSYGADDTEDKMDLLTQAMSNLTSATTDLEDKVIMDHNWKNKGRVSCRNITSSDILNSRVEDLEEFRYDIQQRMVDTVSEVLVAFGREEDTAVTEAENSVYYRIAYDTLQNYISWHKFLQGVVVEHGFAEALLFIRDVSSKLISYRTTYVSKVQCLARTYTYLRDLQDDNWVTQKMHAKRVNRLLSGITKGGGGRK